MLRFARLVFGTIKSVLIILVFILGCLSIVFTQIVGIIVSWGNKEFIHAWLANTKTSFIVLLTTVVTFVSTTPIAVKIISPDIPRSNFQKDSHHRLSTILTSNSVLIANHQIYIEWAFLWWFLHSAGLSGFIYIMLKDSLKKIPVLAFGMKNFDFIFMSRKWQKDQETLNEHLERMDANGRGLGPASGVTRVNDVKGWPQGTRREKTWPYALVMFPEGTNLSANTREKSEVYAAKIGRKPFKNLLLPRTTGLRYSLLKLKGSVEHVYDITIGYSGVDQNEYGQDIYSLDKVFLAGENPANVQFYIRSFKIDDIPIGELHYADKEKEQLAAKEFEDWLFGLWEQKDKLLDTFYETGSFVSKDDEEKDEIAIVDTEFKVSFLELLQVFAVPAAFLIVVRMIYSLIHKVLV